MAKDKEKPTDDPKAADTSPDKDSQPEQGDPEILNLRKEIEAMKKDIAENKELKKKLANVREENAKLRAGGKSLDVTQLGDKHNKSFRVVALGSTAERYGMTEDVIERAFDESEAIRQYMSKYEVDINDVSKITCHVYPNGKAKEATKQAA